MFLLWAAAFVSLCTALRPADPVIFLLSPKVSKEHQVAKIVREAVNVTVEHQLPDGDHCLEVMKIPVSLGDTLFVFTDETVRICDFRVYGPLPDVLQLQIPKTKLKTWKSVQLNFTSKGGHMNFFVHGEHKTEGLTRRLQLIMNVSRATSFENHSIPRFYRRAMMQRNVKMEDALHAWRVAQRQKGSSHPDWYPVFYSLATIFTAFAISILLIWPTENKHRVSYRELYSSIMASAKSETCQSTTTTNEVRDELQVEETQRDEEQISLLQSLKSVK